MVSAPISQVRRLNPPINAFDRIACWAPNPNDFSSRLKIKLLCSTGHWQWSKEICWQKLKLLSSLNMRPFFWVTTLSLQMGWGKTHILAEMNGLSGEIFAGIYSDTKIAKCVGCKTVICKPFWWKTISSDNIKIIYCECIFGNSGIMTAFQH